MCNSVTVPFADGSTRAYPVVTNQQVSIDPDAQPVVTMIYEDPITREDEEGLAVLREPDPRGCDADWWDGRVEFVDEPGQYYSRRIYRK